MAEISHQEKPKEAGEGSTAYGEDEPRRGEVLVWYLYELCSYFVLTVLIPVVFPLIITQTVGFPPEPDQGWLKSYKGFRCNQSEMQLYEGLVHRAIKLGSTKLSPLQWTSVSWIIGLILSSPLFFLVSILLDHAHHHRLVAASATITGAVFCLPTGILRKAPIFPLYIIIIVAANTVSSAAHARHLGLMIRALAGPTMRGPQFWSRKSFGSFLSLCSTSAGCLGAAIMSSFMYHMLGRSDRFTALWVVSIFSGLLWGLGTIHVFTANRDADSLTDSEPDSSPIMHVFSIFRYPDALGGIVGVFLSSFMSMCLFAAGLIYAIGYVCTREENVLFVFLVYFMVPLVTLPAAHPLQRAMGFGAEKMQLLGFVLSTFTSGFGFYYHRSVWHKGHFFLFAAIQGTATGLLYAFGRVLWLHCSPAGKEGSFSVWFSWARALGSCAGFALATSMPGNVGTSFGISFCAGIIGMVILIFGNISSTRGAKAAGHVIKSEKASPAHGFEDEHPRPSKGSILSYA